MILILNVVILGYLAQLCVAEAKCRTTFVEYTSSPLELKWAENVKEWQRDVCKHISKAEMEWWIGNVTVLMGDRKGSVLVTQDAKPPPAPWSYIFSVFTYKKVCRDPSSESAPEVEYIHIPIEPTAAIARDPRKVRSYVPLELFGKFTPSFLFGSVLGADDREVHPVQGLLAAFDIRRCDVHVHESSQ